MYTHNIAVIEFIQERQAGFMRVPRAHVLASDNFDMCVCVAGRATPAESRVAWARTLSSVDVIHLCTRL